MMYTKAIVKELLHLLIARLPYASPEERPLRMFFTAELIERPFSKCSFLESNGCLDRLLSCMHKYHDLMSLAHKFSNFFKRHTIKVFARLGGSRLASDADEMLFERNRSEGRVEVEQTRGA